VTLAAHRVIVRNGLLGAFLAVAGAAASQTTRADAARTEMVESIHRGEGRRALAAARQAADAKASTEPDSLEVARFIEELGVEFVTADIDSMRPLGLPLLFEALELRQRAAGENSIVVADAKTIVSTYYYLLGRYDESAEWQRQSLAVLESRHDVPDSVLAFTRKELGLVYYQLGRYTEARQLWETALAFAGRNDPFLAANIHNSLGELMRLEVRYAEARQHFERSTQVADSLIAHAPDPDTQLQYERFVGIVWLNRANLLYEESRYEEAQERYRWVVDLFETKGAGQPMVLPSAYLNVAEICRFQGRYAEAERYYRRAVELGRQEAGADNPDTFWFLHSLGELFVEQARYVEADSAFRQCVSLLERSGTAGEARIGLPLRSLGNLMRAQGRHDEAGEFYRRSSAAYERVVGPESPELARTRVALARCLFEQPQPNVAEARAQMDAALRVLHATGVFPEARLDAELLSAEIVHRDGDVKRARDALAAGLADAEMLRTRASVDDRGRAAFFADYAPAFEKLVAWNLDLGDVAGAVQSIERFRARVLLEQMRIAGVDLLDGLPDSTRARLQQREQAASLSVAEADQRLTMLRQALASAAADSQQAHDLMRARDRALEELRVVQGEVRRASPLWNQMLAAGDEIVSVQQIQSDLVQGDEAWLVYHVGAEASHVILVERKRARAFELRAEPVDAAALGIASGAVTRAQLAQVLVAARPAQVAQGRGVAVQSVPDTPPVVDVRPLLGVIESPAVAFAAPEAQRLHALWNVLVPAALRRDVRGLDRVVVVPDGVLHRFPFEALILDAPRSGAPPRFWLEHGPIVRYAPSATVLWTQARGATGGTKVGGGILSVSDPVFGAVPPELLDDTQSAEASLQRLPGTAAESERLAAAFGAPAVVFLRQDAATEARVRRELHAKRYVHLATHGITANRRDDVYAALALTPGGAATDRADDGFLELSEVYGLHLDADLVVLSACSTHEGAWIEGDGVFALTRGFLASGCRRVVGSLWRVDDASTAEMVGTFFGSIAAAERGKRQPDFARALRDARLRLLRSAEWSHPYHWAAFVMLGSR
jgi:CHAT domain-containing protein/tetratricopeptide (TPR) repeat protein